MGYQNLKSIWDNYSPPSQSVEIKKTTRGYTMFVNDKQVCSYHKKVGDLRPRATKLVNGLCDLGFAVHYNFKKAEAA